MNLPFEIGQTFWMPITNAEKVTLPCPACKGERVVTIIYGGDERVTLDCEACGIGYGGSRGIVEEWQLEPAAKLFTIEAVTAMYNERWRLRSTEGAECDFDGLYLTEDEAFKASVVLCSEQHERNMQTRQHKRAGAKRTAWSVQYHRNQIADLERQIEWHRSRLTAKPQKVATNG